jgi:alkylation response protein AidB-like acyl-CoA dehydrogenase
VPTRVPGVAVTVYRNIDNQIAADAPLDGVRVAGDALLGAEGLALPIVDEALDSSTALLYAEAVGAMQCANDNAADYPSREVECYSNAA